MKAAENSADKEHGFSHATKSLKRSEALVSAGKPAGLLSPEGTAESQTCPNWFFLTLSIHLHSCQGGPTALNFVISPAPACRGTAADPDFLNRSTIQGDVCGFP